MSFSSTPLGQGRRLDHQTFLNKNNSNAPQRRGIPNSYSYGAPTTGSRSPPKPTKAPLPQADDSEEPALVRFARLKQREQTQPDPSQATASQRPPESWSVRDTSVNIVSAFHQAATTSFDTTQGSANMSSAMTPDEAWASGARKQPMVPRSTSVEYEKETQSTINRRLAPPPSRGPQARVSRPVSKTSSLRHVPDSEGEEEAQPNGRGKTPLQHGIDMVRNLVPATFLLREGSPALGNGHDSMRDQSSYDYSAEEREFQAGNASQKPPSRRTVAAHKKNRMSTDNRAYRPSMSDLDESDEDFEEDGKRTRRKKKKAVGPGGGPLTTLPVAGYDKRKKKRKGTKTNGANGDEEDGSTDDEQGSEQRSQQGATAYQRGASLLRTSVPPQPRQPSVQPHYDSSNVDSSMDIEGLAPVSETEERPPQIEPLFPPSSFSVGATMGRLVHGFVSYLGWIGGCLGNAAAATARGLIHANVIKYFAVGITLWLVWIAVNSGMLDLGSIPRSIPIFKGSPGPYHAPEVPAADLAALSARLLSLEKAVASLSLETDRSRAYIDGDARHRADMTSHIGNLETRIQKESSRAQEAENKFRSSASDNLNVVKKEVTQLASQLQTLRDAEARRPSIGSDEEARAKLKALDERVGNVEGGVKEALEVGKNAAKAGAVAANIADWWNKLATGKTKTVTVKSSDGQDVTALINQLVDTAVMRNSKDSIARVDFALHSGGAKVIPRYTSDTLEVRPSGIGSSVLGFINGGSGYAIGRPPVTALHHEIHAGHCWPFGGQTGQLGINLAAPVYISDITIDHVAHEVAMDLRSAPRQMEVWGRVEGQDNIVKIHEWREQRDAQRRAAEEAGQPIPPNLVDDGQRPRSIPKDQDFIRIANFTYNIHAPEFIQTFPVRDEIKELGMDFGIIILLIKNNWGQDEFTCLYRMRVHGERLGELPLPYPEEDLA
ncbi:uncharacterized protein BXZ73DRAFT_38481 [Epithele typhae]|uniref:uncharacterized protein n=1 Tax=Epithele typhae TaxID=378194 RepID=UPI002008BF38|nr:uncharacterized protein BXZ73DRAFT_38481 [Epithele typhae]KAH9945317.1 hypothetical protein BXZ73DRAFT_38481 [Epithele typhae]